MANNRLAHWWMVSLEEEYRSARVDLFAPAITYGKWIAAATIVCALAVLGTKLATPSTYVATAAVAPVDNSALGSQKLAQLSGLAGLAGVNIGGDRGPSNFDRFTYLMTSAELADWQIRHRNILAVLFPDWDSKANSWRPPAGLVDSVARGMGGGAPPDAYRVATVLEDHVTMDRVPTTDTLKILAGINLIHYTDTDPARAEMMLRYVIEDTNEIIRGQSQDRARSQVGYLTKELQTVETQEYRTTLLKLYSEQEQTLMLAGSHLPYAAELVSGTILPAKKVGKHTVISTAIGAMVGFSLSYFLAILNYNLGSGRQRWTLIRRFTRRSPKVQPDAKLAMKKI